MSTLVLSILQFSVFLGTLFASGEFSYIKRYAYDSITEKTENRKNYVENILANKMPLVYEAEKDVNKITSKVLNDNSTDLSAIQQDKNISKQILHDSTDILTSLMKRCLVNDAYIVLDTGDLYSTGDTEALATVYIRDVNVTTTSAAENKNSDDIIKFTSSGIAEIDQLTDAIQQLQINVKEQSSRVSKIISMSVVGIGAFMYDTDKQTVFISESMLLTLSCDKMPAKDTTISYEQFMSLMADIDERNCTNITGFFKTACDESTEEITTRQYPIVTDTGEQKWFRLSLRRDGTNILGLVQDVTQSVLEMKKIKYERDYDVTTGLLNRRAYYNKIEKLFRDPDKLKTTAFIMLDIDNLKYVNDTYGHDFGDDYITATANVLKNFQFSCGVDLLQGYYFGKPSFDQPTVSPKTTADILRIAEKTKLK